MPEDQQQTDLVTAGGCILDEDRKPTGYALLKATRVFEPKRKAAPLMDAPMATIPAASAASTGSTDEHRTTMRPWS